MCVYCNVEHAHVQQKLWHQLLVCVDLLWTYLLLIMPPQYLKQQCPSGQEQPTSFGRRFINPELNQTDVGST